MGMSVPVDAIATVAVAVIGLVSTVLGIKYQQAASVAASKAQDLADLATLANKVIVAAKDTKIDEPAFQAVVDDLHKLVNG